MNNERFIRRMHGNHYEVYIYNTVVGTIFFDGGYYMPTYKEQRYGEDEKLPQCLTLKDAGEMIAEAHKFDCADIAAEIESERRAEFGMSYICGGGNPDDVGAAYMQLGHLI